MPTIFHQADRLFRTDPGRLWGIFGRLINRGKALECESRVVELEMALMERDREAVALKQQIETLKVQCQASKDQAFGALEDAARWHDRLADMQRMFE